MVNGLALYIAHEGGVVGFSSRHRVFRSNDVTRAMVTLLITKNSKDMNFIFKSNKDDIIYS
jgi:hypothetical protein